MENAEILTPTLAAYLNMQRSINVSATSISLSASNAINIARYTFLLALSYTLLTSTLATFTFRIIISWAINYALIFKRNVRIFWHFIFEIKICWSWHRLTFLSTNTTTIFVFKFTLWTSSCTNGGILIANS